MPIYSSEAGELIKEFETALQQQKQALSDITAAIKIGTLADLDKTADTINFHNDRVMRLHAALQPYRLDKN